MHGPALYGLHSSKYHRKNAGNCRSCRSIARQEFPSHTLGLGISFFLSMVHSLRNVRFSCSLNAWHSGSQTWRGFGTKGVTGLRIRCCHLLTLLPDLVTIIYVRGEVLGKNWPKIAGDFRKVNITFRLDVYCRYM